MDVVVGTYSSALIGFTFMMKEQEEVSLSLVNFDVDYFYCIHFMELHSGYKSMEQMPKNSFSKMAYNSVRKAHNCFSMEVVADMTKANSYVNKCFYFETC